MRFKLSSVKWLPFCPGGDELMDDFIMLCGFIVFCRDHAFSRALNYRLDAWAEIYGIYVEAQNGFRRGRGTVDSAFVLYSIVNEYLEQGHTLYAFFIDYCKAFDHIVHDNLWYKLLNVGVRGKMIDIICFMYSQVRTNVFNNNEKSETFKCKLGVRQGECLSPFLFSMYVNDLGGCWIIRQLPFTAIKMSPPIY